MPLRCDQYAQACIEEGDDEEYPDEEHDTMGLSLSSKISESCSSSDMFVVT